MRVTSLARLSAVLFLCPAMLAQDRFSQGLEAFEKGLYADAERILSGTDSPAAETVLALTYAATGRCAQAETVLRERRSDPKLRRLAGLGLARCLIAGRRFAEAAQPLDALADRVSR